MKAFSEGKTIQVRTNSISKWIETTTPTFDLLHEYRIKPEPKYRSFKNKEECWQEMLNHQPFGWITDGPRICNVICIREDGILANTNLNGTFYEFESSINLKFADGTPFGIIEN